jgi:hypothetical protein
MRHVGAPLPSAAAEEVLDIRNIQGNILAGFNKDHQALLFLKITDPAKAKRWLQFITPTIATMEEVLSFNRLFKAMRTRRADEGQRPGRHLAEHRLFPRWHRRSHLVARSRQFIDEGFQAFARRLPLLRDPPLRMLRVPGKLDDWKDRGDSGYRADCRQR